MNRRRDLIGASYRQRRATAIANSGGMCCLCGEAMNLSVNGRHPDGPTLEHLLPVSRGGSGVDPANLSASHRRCNTSRGNRLISEFRAELEQRAPMPRSRKW